MSPVSVLETPFAALNTMNFLKLYTERELYNVKSSTEGAKPFHAANSLGFFYLDLRGTLSLEAQDDDGDLRTILDNVSDLFEIMKQLWTYQHWKERLSVCVQMVGILGKCFTHYVYLEECERHCKAVRSYKGLGRSFFDCNEILQCIAIFPCSKSNNQSTH